MSDILEIIKQFETFEKLGFKIYLSGCEYPPLDVDMFVSAWKNNKKVDLIKYINGEYKVYNGVNIG